ncbi:MAG: RNA methyltransferase [Bryobacteraceae bacterium]
MSAERTPFQVTTASTAYEGIHTLPVVILLENIRSLYNVGSFFRTGDAAAIEKLVLCGITGRPPHKGILKTALGSEETVPWEYQADSVNIATDLRQRGYELAMMETTTHAVDLFDWTPRFPVCVIFGNEVDGVTPALAELCDTHVRIPMLGMKHSLNVATAGGVVMYELLRKYRRLGESGSSGRFDGAGEGPKVR